MSPAQAFTLSLAQSGIDRDTRVWELTEAEIDALLRPVIEAEREACAGVADTLGGNRVERDQDGRLRAYDMHSNHGRGDAILNAQRVRAQTIAAAIRGKAQP